MIVLVANAEPHHSHERDSTVGGELVAPVVVECGEPACATCTCAWVGLASHGTTDVAMVADRPGVTRAALRSRVHGWLDARGLVDQIVRAVESGAYGLDGEPFDDPVAAVAELVDAHVAEIEAICSAYPVGTVVGRLGSLVAPRPGKRAA